MGRGGQTKDRSGGPERRCIATGEVLPKAGLIRFVTAPTGEIVPDVLEKLPGRGIWVKADHAALTRAVARRLFSRGARQSVTIPDGLTREVERQLTQRVIDLISLSRKSGCAVAGYEKVRSWLDAGDALVLIQAIDGSARGKTKLRPPDRDDSYIGILTAQELGLAFGREHVIHAALGAGGLTRRVVEEAARLSGLRRTDEGGDALGKD